MTVPAFSTNHANTHANTQGNTFTHHAPQRVAFLVERFFSQSSSLGRWLDRLATDLTRDGHGVTIFLAYENAGRTSPDPTPHDIQVLPSRRRSWPGLLRAFDAWLPTVLDPAEFDAVISLSSLIPAPTVIPWSGLLNTPHNHRAWHRLGRLARYRPDTRLALRYRLRKRERAVLANPMVKRWVAISPGMVHTLTDALTVARPDVFLQTRTDNSSDDGFAPMAHDENTPHDDGGIMGDATTYEATAQDGALIVYSAKPAITVLPDAHTRQQLRDTVRRTFAIPADAAVLAFASRHPDLDGLPTFLQSLAHVRAASVDRDVVAMLAVVPSYRWLTMVNKLGLREAVRFVGPTESLVPLLSAADLAVTLPLYHPCPRMALESHNMQTPIITPPQSPPHVPSHVPSQSSPQSPPRFPSQSSSQIPHALHAPRDPSAVAHAITALLETAVFPVNKPTSAVPATSADAHVDRLSDPDFFPTNSPIPLADLILRPIPVN